MVATGGRRPSARAAPARGGAAVAEAIDGAATADEGFAGAIGLAARPAVAASAAVDVLGTLVAERTVAVAGRAECGASGAGSAAAPGIEVVGADAGAPVPVAAPATAFCDAPADPSGTARRFVTGVRLARSRISS